MTARTLFWRLRFDRTGCVKAGLKAFLPLRAECIYRCVCVLQQQMVCLLTTQQTAVGFKGNRQPFQISVENWIKEDTKAYWGHHVRSLYVSGRCQLRLIDRVLVGDTMLVSVFCISVIYSVTFQPGRHKLFWKWHVYGLIMFVTLDMEILSCQIPLMSLA